MRRIPTLDGLRAVSIAMVVIGHWSEMRFTGTASIAGAFASLGVRIFFVLSGYLITRLLLEERHVTGTIALRSFYLRRARRILPASLLYMAVVFFVFHRELSSSWGWAHALAALFYVTNFDYAHPWFLGHLWSLSVEEQFYLLWPAALKKWYAHRVPALLASVGVAAVFRLACGLLHQHGRWDETLPAQAPFLALGCLAAVKPVASGQWPVGKIAKILKIVKIPLAFPPLVWLGKISYSLYLWQQVFVFGRGRPWYGILVALGAASLSYYLLERPLQRKVPSGQWSVASKTGAAKHGLLPPPVNQQRMTG